MGFYKVHLVMTIVFTILKCGIQCHEVVLRNLNAVQVLWPECGWQPVSLTDLITSTSVKKVYHRATLCVHPDKVQQKGATVRQKYIAEKVFDLLKVTAYV